MDPGEIPSDLVSVFTTMDTDSNFRLCLDEWLVYLAKAQQANGRMWVSVRVCDLEMSMGMFSWMRG